MVPAVSNRCLITHKVERQPFNSVPEASRTRAVVYVRRPIRSVREAFRTQAVMYVRRFLRKTLFTRGALYARRLYALVRVAGALLTRPPVHTRGAALYIVDTRTATNS